MKRVRHFTRPIPVCQDKLREIAGDLKRSGLWGYAKRVEIWASKLSRRASVRRAPNQQRKVTRSDATKIALYMKRHPSVSYQTAAHRINANTGRMSEATAGIKI